MGKPPKIKYGAVENVMNIVQEALDAMGVQNV